MGEIADDMLNGRMCSECGTYFKKAHGHPVLCKSCWKPGSETPKAVHKEYN